MKRLLLAALVAVAPLAAGAQSPVCGAYEVITGRLNSKYGEVLRVRMADHSQITEIWSSEEQQIWTIITRNVHGVACLRAAGRGVEWFEEPGEKA